MTLSQELRQSIIQQVLSGKQYRDISKEMGISIGSIANIAKKHRAENERSCSKQGQPKSSDVNISEVIKSIDSSIFHGVELAPKNGVEDLDTTIDPSTISNNRNLELIPQSTEDSQVNTSTYPRTPLASPTLDDSSSQGQDLRRQQQSQEITTTTAITKENGYSAENSQKGGPLSWFTPLMTNGTSNHPLKSEVSAVNHIYDTPLKLGTNSPNKIEEFEPDVDFVDTPYQEQSEISCKTVNQNDEEEIDFSDSPAKLDIEEEGFLLDSDPAVIWPKLLKQIKHEKDQRRHEILVLERKKKILDIREDQINHDLEELEGIRLEISNREAEAEPLLSLARQFQSMGLDFDSLLPYIENLREQAARGIDFKTAATYMVYEIKSYHQLGGIQKELVSARNQLQMLKTATTQRERGLNMLAELESKFVFL